MTIKTRTQVYYDDQEQCMVIADDRLRGKPLYFPLNGGGFSANQQIRDLNEAAEHYIEKALAERASHRASDIASGIALLDRRHEARNFK